MCFAAINTKASFFKIATLLTLTFSQIINGQIFNQNINSSAALLQSACLQFVIFIVPINLQFFRFLHFCYEIRHLWSAIKAILSRWISTINVDKTNG